MSEPESQAVNILVADDETIVLSLVRDALEDEGFDIRTAASGEEALQILEREGIDLLITDIRMPHMDGTELVRLARERNADIGVIYMTGYANLNSAKDAIKQGAFDYILKPFELSEIRQAVHKAVQKIRERSAGNDTGAQLERLSDLNQMLFTAGDRKSLGAVSLRFAMMHFEAQRGALVHWDRARTGIHLVTIDGNQTEDREMTDPSVLDAVGSLSPDSFREPVIVSSSDDHPLLRQGAGPVLRDILLPTWFEADTSMIVVPLCRADAFYGVIMIQCTGDTASVQGADFRMLTIAAGQLAVSLENLFLLEETQTAYGRLKELQDETIELEKMATRGEMSAEIGHEMNNFLGVIAGNLSLLEHQVRKADITGLDKYLSAILSNVEKMKKFTSNLMDLTPIASRKETVFFEQLLAEVIDYLKPQKRFRGVTIDTTETDGAIPFEADSIHIQQLLYNLFNNAADATQGCERRKITASISREPDSNRFSFIITDTGVGIEPEYLEKAFEQKFTTKKNGHGFGLLVCKRIVDSHNGSLHVDSKPGAGTTIRIDFPVAQSQPALTPA